MRTLAIIGLFWMVGCAVAEPGLAPDAPAVPQSISNMVRLPESLAEQAGHVREFDGLVALVEPIELLETIEGALVPTGIDGVYTATTDGVYAVRVVDALGSEWLAEDVVRIRTVASDPTVVDEAGEPRTDWIVSGVLPMWMRGMPEEGLCVVFVSAPDEDGVRHVWYLAASDGERVSGARTRSMEDLPLEALRLTE